MKLLHKNETWKLVDLPPRRKFVGNKWVYKINKNNDGLLEPYKSHSVEKSYVQKSSIYFNEIFSPIVKLSIVKVLLAQQKNEIQSLSNWM